MSTISRILREQANILLVVIVLGVLAVLVAPIPAYLLDVLILANFAFALLLLLLTFHVPKPVEFSTFPSLLLIATLFRLSLNVAATRLILTDADAGRVIGAIGSFVVAGNYVIGLIVFLILVVVQYVVVTSGAQRVSEVAARFTLDSLPGRQMSIDADLNMGLIDQAEAQRRRKALEREAGFYGSMDGASKFVKGDAIAGIVILLINIVGGLVIGVMQLGLPWSQALHTYTLLTVGDGIVTQVPALVIAVGTGIIVTRSASDVQLSSEALRQVMVSPKAIFLVACALAGLMLLPGFPKLPLALIFTIALLSGIYALRKRGKAGVGPDSEAEAAKESERTDDDYKSLKLEAIEVHVGDGLKGAVASEQALLTERVAAFRKQFALDMGMMLPRVRFRDSNRLAPTAYEIQIFGVPTAKGELQLDRTLAIHASGDVKSIEGIEAREPTYGLPALWIEDAVRDSARAMRYTLVDPQTVFVTHLVEVMRQSAVVLLTRSEVELILQRVRQDQPGLLEDLVPAVLTVTDVQKVLQGLLREKVSIRNIEAILEALTDAGRATKDPSMLIEQVRQRLAFAICQSLMGEAGALQVITLDPQAEHRLAEGLRRAEAGASLVIEPNMADQLLNRLALQAERMMKGNLLPVLLCSPDLRRHLRTLSERLLPHMRVLSLTEIPNSVPLKSFGVVSL